MKMHLSLVLSSVIIIDHLAAENQVPEFALNWHERIRNVYQEVIFLASCPDVLHKISNLAI